MAVCYDHVHPCPRCGGAWTVRMLAVMGGGSDNGALHYRAAAGSGACSNAECSMSATELAAVRETRRRLGWDRWLTRTG